MRKRSKKKNKHAVRLIISFIAIIGLVSLIYPTLSNYLLPCANTLSCKESLTLNVENNQEGIFQNQKVMPPQIDLAKIEHQTAVLGTDTETKEGDTSEEKHIYVNLATQTLSAYQGDTLFMQTPISSGLWGKTPTGEFDIWIKIRSTRMSGGSGADFYDLPNVPYVMFFSNDQVAASRGFSLHGTYWHNNFGHPMSHGCVNMKTTDIAKLYDWATPVSDGPTTHSTELNPGTKITIYDGL